MTRTRLVLGVLVLLLGLAGVVTLPTTSGRLTGTVANSTNTAATGLYPQGCTAAVRAAGAWLAYPFDEPVGSAFAADASGNNRGGGYTLTGVGYRAAGPCPRDGSRAITLNGSAGYVKALNTATAGPQTFAVQVWFRTGTTSGGKLAGFGNGGTLTDLSVSYDRHVYMTNDGRLVAGVFPNGYRTATSTARYNDNAWHHAVVTLGTVGTATGGLRLYVDGLLVASDPTAPGAQVFNGTWRFGFDNLDTWPDQPTSRYFAGSLAYAAVWTTALTPTQVIELYYAGR